MRRIPWTLLALSLIPTTLFANVGVFTGNGHDIELVTSSDIQMVSERVVMTAGRGDHLGAMDRVEYRCSFELKNHSPESVSIQVGFPLDGQYREFEDPEKVDVPRLITSYDFIAQEQGKVYTPRYASRDKDDRVSKVFLWDMGFEGNEEKTLHVSYSLPMSSGLASTEKKQGVDYEKRWYGALQTAIHQRFAYVTETGKSWKGDIEQATFKAFVKRYEEYLAERGFEEETEASRRAREERARRRGREGPLLIAEPAIHRTVSPEDFVETRNDNLLWQHEDYEPGAPVVVAYLQYNMPRTREDVAYFIRRAFGDTPAREDLEDLEAIIRVWFGESVTNERIQPFLDNQIWYPRKTDETIPDEVLEQLASYK